ncbi:MAG: DUF1178 family protein [Hydrogenophaga sp.]|uniref:DUF1178 family protein n=1 Tax=Hydrogenophaga sp. TaxID=1904254 RepID=UPI002AB96783|nr:DUF1178 family protein [Hydrogenophaga sp.]MDZ4188007.1 DUF1178 family protein [Hydrogenophaga sp.]
MKVLNLQCAHQHDFEGWFSSEDDYTNQLAQGLLICPLCGDEQIQKMLSAPRLNLRTNRADSTAPTTEEPVVNNTSNSLSPSGSSKQLQAQLINAMREVIANTEDVGERFADQARAMHHGDMDPRNIRGRTSPAVAIELMEEGIDVLPLPAIPALKETLQ